MSESKEAFLFNYFNKQAPYFEQLAFEVSKKPSRKKVHELRITIRRLRVLLWLSNHSLLIRPFEKLSSSLHELGQTLGYQRELEVSIKEAKRHHLPTKKLKTQLLATQKKTLKKMTLKKQDKIHKQILKVGKKLKKDSNPNLDVAILKLRKRLTIVTQKTTFTEKELHRLRIFVKKIRYIFEVLGKPTQPLQSLQYFLGQIHDLEVLQSLSKQNKSLRREILQKQKKVIPQIKPTLIWSLKQLETSPTMIHSR